MLRFEQAYLGEEKSDFLTLVFPEPFNFHFVAKSATALSTNQPTAMLRQFTTERTFNWRLHVLVHFELLLKEVKVSPSPSFRN